MKIILIILLLNSFSNLLIAQTISGRIKDILSNEPIAYAHVFATIYDIGTISNELGEFEIKIPVSTKGNTIKISHIGYNSLSFKAKQDTLVELFLTSDIVYLDEIIIGGNTYEIVEEVFSALKNADSGYGKAFYRQITKQNDIPTEFIEAFYNLSHSPKGVNKLSVDQARFARKISKDIPIFKFINFAYLSVGLNIYSDNKGQIAFPFSEYFFEYYNFHMIDMFTKDSENFVVIEFIPNETLNKMNGIVPQKGNFTYNVTTNTLVEYFAQVYHSLGIDNVIIDDDYSIEVSSPKFEWKVSFSDRGGFYGIDLILVENAFNMLINNEIYPVKVFSKMVFYEKSSRRHRRLREPGIELENVSVFEKARYRPIFWRDNPVIKRTSEVDNMIKSFEEENAFGSYFKH